MRLLLAALAATVLLVSTQAEAKTRHHHRHKHHRTHVVAVQPRVTCDNLGCSDWHGRGSYTVNRQTGDIRIGAVSVGGLVAEAERHLGATGSIVGMARAWCGAYARLVMRNVTGRDPGASFNLARNWASLGSPSAPVPGAVAVARHHVGFIKAVEGNRILLVSGNHGRHVASGWYPIGRFIAFRSV